MLIFNAIRNAIDQSSSPVAFNGFVLTVTDCCGNLDIETLLLESTIFWVLPSTMLWLFPTEVPVLAIPMGKNPDNTTQSVITIKYKRFFISLFPLTSFF